jgi:hypothetical protein
MVEIGQKILIFLLIWPKIEKFGKRKEKSILARFSVFYTLAISLYKEDLSKYSQNYTGPNFDMISENQLILIKNAHFDSEERRIANSNTR